jgi:hypothetical protein
MEWEIRQDLTLSRKSTMGRTSVPTHGVWRATSNI